MPPSDQTAKSPAAGPISLATQGMCSVEWASVHFQSCLLLIFKQATALPVAYYIHQLSPVHRAVQREFRVSHWYGFAYVMAFVVGYWLYRRLAERGYGELPPEKVADFITLAAVFGVMLGGRLGYIRVLRLGHGARQSR